MTDWDELCDNCYYKPRRPGGCECRACAEYRRTHNGQPRPLSLIERAIERENEQRSQS